MPWSRQVTALACWIVCASIVGDARDVLRLVSGVYSAVKAAGLDPVRALHYE